MSEQIRISAKNLGELALVDFCPRCFWLKLKLHNRLPFQIFPGIFSSIDAYTKNVVHGYIDRFHSGPPWLAELGELRGYQEPPHWSKLNWVDPNTNILLTGTPDGVLIRADGSLIIVDYKTAKYSGQADILFPMYTTQINSYAMIGEKTKLLSPVSALSLIYCEPVTSPVAASAANNQRDEGFAMGFHANIHSVPLTPEIIPPLLNRTRELFNMPKSPPGRDDCRNCRLVDQLAEIA